MTAVKHYHHYLYGTRFIIRTDQSTLRWLLTTFKNPEGQISRWTEVLSTYNFDIQHRTGRLHGNCDGLSRILCNHCPRCRRLEEKEEQNSSEPYCLCKNPDPKGPLVEQGISRGSESGPSLSPYNETLAQGKNNIKPNRRVTTRSQMQSCIVMKQWLHAKSTDDIINEQHGDRKNSAIMAWKAESNERPNWERVSHLDADYKTYWSQWNRLILKDGILYRR